MVINLILEKGIYLDVINMDQFSKYIHKSDIPSQKNYSVQFITSFTNHNDKYYKKSQKCYPKIVR